MAHSEQSQSPPLLIQMLAHDLRWHMLRELAVSDRRVNELVASVGQPANLVSYHLKKLRDSKLVNTRRSEADGRDTYYSLDLDQLRDLYQQAGQAIHPAIVATGDYQPTAPSGLRVLIVCTHNSARSQMAEGLFRHFSSHQFDVQSAGSHPTTIHPDAIATMDAFGIDIRQQTVNHISEFITQAFDVVITVCDNAREVCPMFEGQRQHIHWGFTDPAKIADPDARQHAFRMTAKRLQQRIIHFLNNLDEGATA